MVLDAASATPPWPIKSHPPGQSFPPTTVRPMTKHTKGSIVWQDLTVPNAGEIRDFYTQVVGWEFRDVQMGGYSDYNMLAEGDQDGTAGICHARGSNADLPRQWLIYITVDNVDASSKRCVQLGGKIIDGPRPLGTVPFCVIQDPAGAVCALIEKAS